MKFISWIKYQRRNATICERYQGEAEYIHYPWQDKSKLHKIWATLLKAKHTWQSMNRHDGVIFLQIPSVFLLYTAALYKLFNPRKRLVADCHNNMFYDSPWSKFPLATACLARMDVAIAHNNCVLEHMNESFKSLKNLVVIKDLVPSLEHDGRTMLDEPFIFIPCSLGNDEPVVEMLQAIAKSPDVKFVITKRPEQVQAKLPANMALPDNLICTGFLSEEDFNTYLTTTQAVLVLTTREGTQPSGAIEAMGARRGLILSDVNTARILFSDLAVFCENSVTGIAKAVKAACAQAPADFEKLIRDYEQDSLKALGDILNVER